MALRSVYVDLALRVRGWQAGIATARQGLRDLGGEVEKLRKDHREKFNDLARTTALAGAGIAGAFAVVTKAAMDFDKEMSAVGAVADGTAADLDALREAAIQAGKATQYSATQAAQAEEELAKAGISTKDILGGGLTGALNLAAAGQMDLADAATIAAQAMNVFHLSGSAVPHIADVLASAANKSAADMRGLGDALKQGGNVAAQMGLSLEDTTGVLAAFADRALVGSDAGTSLKSMLLALSAPSEKAAGVMQRLGIEIYDVQGNFIGVTRLAGVLQERLGGLTQAERNAALATIFGSDATRAATVLYGLGADGVRNYIDAVDDSGAAAKTAAAKTDNLAGDIERLRGSIETLAIESGSGANGGLRVLVKTVDGLVTAFSDLPGPIQATSTILAGVAGTGLLAAAGFLKARQTTADLMETLNAMGPAGTRAAKGITLAGKAIGYMGVAVAGVALAFEGYKLLQRLEGLDATAEDSTEHVQEFSKALLELGKSGIVSGRLEARYGKDLAGLRGEIESVAKAEASLARIRDAGIAGKLSNAESERTVALAKAKEDLEDVDKALADLASNGNASAALLSLTELASRSGVPFAELRGMLPQYSKAADEAATANTGLAKGFASASQQASILSQGLDDAVAAGQTLLDVWSELHGATLDADKAMLAANRSIDEMTKTLADNKKAAKDHKVALDGDSTAALQNRIVIEEAAKAAADAAEKKRIEGGTIDDATKVYDAYIAKLYAALIAQGLTEDQVKDLIATYAKMPPLVATQVVVTGIDHAAQQAKHLLDRLDRLDGATVSVGTGPKRAGSNRWGGLYEHAAAGALREAGMYSAVNPGRYMIAEPETGGEAFIPRKGSYGRSMSILSGAANWYGADVVPRGAMAASAPTFTPTLIVQVQVNPITGEVLRQKLISNGLDRGIPPATLRVAYP